MSEKEPPTIIVGTPRRASAQPSWRWTKRRRLVVGVEPAARVGTVASITARRAPATPLPHDRDRRAGRVDGDRVHVDRGDDRGERHGRVVGEPAGAEQADLLGGGREEQDVAQRARRRRQSWPAISISAAIAARIVDGAVADPVGRAFGPAEAEMVPVGEQQQALAGGAAAAQPADDIAGLDAAGDRWS